jgi:pimeloyl-ACP methyl ester carboxylesterase
MSGTGNDSKAIALPGVESTQSVGVPHLRPIIDGPPEGDLLLFVQGWPDDHTVWDQLVAALRDRYRCVRFDLPNYALGERRRWGYSHDEIVAGLAHCVRSVSRGMPVTVIGHDWGAYWTYALHYRHPELVSRLVGLDVAPDLKPTSRELLFIIAYQWWLLAAFVLGGRVGAWMTRRQAALAGSPRQGDALDSSVNYPYLYYWRDIVSGRAGKRLAGYSPKIPLLYVYGEDKPARFHSDEWLELVMSRAGNQVVALDGTSHWVMRDPRLNALVRSWLDGTRA